MYISRSLLASAIVLSLSSSGDASVLHRKPNGDAPRVQRRWSLPSLFGKRQGVQELECPETSFADLLNANPEERVQSFCNDWLDLQPTTVVVEYTPTSTSTTSADTTTTVTSITRVIETETLFVAATTTAAPIVPRWVNMANMAEASEIDSIANDIVQSVIASGTTSAVEAAAITSKSPKRVAAEEGLATACSCKLVAPTSTVTVSFALPAVTTTVGYRRIIVSSETETRTFTVTTTVDGVPRSEEPTTAPTSGGSSDTGLASSAEAAITSTASITATAIESTAVTSTLNPSNELAPVVTAIPFGCPDAHNKHVDQVAGPFRLDYLILCDTAIEGEDRIGGPIPVDSETACAAQCSLINAASGEDTCQTASYAPNTDGRTGGFCSIYGSQRTVIDSPGSITIVHTGTFANGDECAALSATPASIDTSALVASVTSAGLVISTPGLVTSTSGGGEFHTYVSANSTDPAGNVHWSWYQVDAASMNWWAVYRTSWACTVSYTRTIEQAASTIEGSTTTLVDVTTIIGGGETTIISGTETSTITGESGLATPTFVSASTTGGNGETTTFFSSAVEASAAGSGAITPSATATAIVTTINVTSVLEGSAVFTLSGESAAATSSGAAGVVSPSPSVKDSAPVSSTASPIQESGSAAITVSGEVSTSSSAASEGVISPSTGGSAELTVSDSLASANSTGDQGVISPSTTGGSAEVTISGEASSASSTGGQGVVSPSVTESPTVSTNEVSITTESEEWDEESSYGRPSKSTATPSVSVTSGEAVVTVSIGTSVINSTGANGVITPTIVTEATILTTESSSPEIVNSTALPTQVTLEGSQAVTIENATSTVSSTGGNGVVSTSPSEVVVTVITGVQNLTVSGGVSIVESTGEAGVIPVPTTVVVTEIQSLSVVLPSVISGGQNLTLSGGILTISSTGDAGSISAPTTVVVTETQSLPLASASVISGAQNLTISGEVATANSTDGAGVLPAPTTVVITETQSLPLASPSVIEGSGNITLSGEVSTVNSTGGAGSISAPSTIVVTETESLSLASPSVTEGSGNLTVSGEVATANSTGGTGIIPAPSTVVVTETQSLPLASPSVIEGSGNLTISGDVSAANSTGGVGIVSAPSTVVVTTTESLPVASPSVIEGIGNFTAQGGTVVILTTGDSGVVSPITTISNTTELPTTTAVEASSTPGETLTTSGDDRDGDWSRTHVFTSNATTELPPSATLPPASVNSTITLTVLTTLNATSTSASPTENLSSTEDDRTGDFSRSFTASETAPAPTFNATTEVFPSATLPPVSLNSTITATVLTALNSTSTAVAPTEILSSTEDNRTGDFSRSGTASESVPAPTFNATTEVPASATPPPVSLNSTTTLTILTVLSTTSTSVTSSEALSSTEDDRTGDFSRPPTASASVPAPTFNATTEVPASVTPPPVSLNSTTTILVVSNGTTTEVLTSTEDDRTGDFSRPPTASESIPVPTFNATTGVPASVTPPPVSLNSTTTVLIVSNNTATEILTSSEDDRTGDFSRSRTASGSGSVPAPTLNTTTTIAPSVTPPPVSLNTTTTVLPVLNNATTEVLTSSEDDRTGDFSRSSTATGSRSLPVPILNATTTIAPSVTPPPVSLNSTTTVLVVSNGTTTEALTSTEDDRTGDFSRSLTATGSGSLPVPSSNATTGVPPQITVVVTVSSTLAELTPFSNSTVPVTASSGVPSASANSTAFLPTGTGLLPQGTPGTVTVTVNSTLSLPLPTGNLTLIPPVTANITEAVPTPTGNITFPVLSTGVSLVSVNYSTVSSFSVGNISTILPTPSTSLEITSSVVLPTGNVTAPSATPSASLNSTVPLFPTSNSTILISSTDSEACPTATEFSVRTRVSIITTTIIETIPVGPTTCVTTGAVLPTGNVTAPTGTGLVVALTVDLPMPTAEPVSLFRSADEPATPEQIEAACAASGNVLVAPNLTITSDDSTPGWTVNATASSIEVSSQTTQEFDGQIARFRSAYPGTALTIDQPLTLCPDRQYEVSALSQQPDVLSKCTVVFLVDNAPVFTVTPTSSWREESGRFTAGSGTAGASPLLQVEASCAGQVGAPAGVDADGFMVVNVGNVTVVATSSK